MELGKALDRSTGGRDSGLTIPHSQSTYNGKETFTFCTISRKGYQIQGKWENSSRLPQWKDSHCRPEEFQGLGESDSLACSLRGSQLAGGKGGGFLMKKQASPVYTLVSVYFFFVMLLLSLQIQGLLRFLHWVTLDRLSFPLWA